MTAPIPAGIAGLQARLEALIGTGGTLSLDAAILPKGAVQTFLACLPGKALLLQNAQTVLSSAGSPAVLTVTGELSEPWHLQGLTDAQLTSLRLSITFTQESPADPVDSQLSVLQAALRIAAQSFPMSGLLDSDGRMTLGLATGAPVTYLSLTRITALVADSRLSTEKAAGLAFFDSLSLEALSVAFSFDPATPVTLQATASVTTDWAILPKGLFDLKGVTLSVQADFRPRSDGTWGTTFTGQLRASTHLVEDFDVLVQLASPEWKFDVLPRPGQALPGLSDLAAVVGGEPLRQTVNVGMKALDLGTVLIDGISVAFDPDNKKLLYMSCGAHMPLAGANLSLFVLLPEFSFSGALAETPGTSGITLKTLLQDRLNPSGDFPDIGLAGLSLFADPPQGDYRLGVQLEADWPLLSCPGAPPLTLTLAELTLEKSTASITASLAAGLSLAGFDLFLTGGYDSASDGWSFSAEGGGPAVPLGQLLQTLAVNLGAHVPTAWSKGLPDIHIDHLSVSYTARSRTFTIVAAVQGTGKIPLGLGSCDAELRVNLTSAPEQATGKLALSGSMKADVKIGDALFTVEYDLGPSADVFAGSWKQERGETVGIDDLAKALNLPDSIKFPDVPAGLDLALTEAVFSFSVTSKSFILSASSKNYGDAFFVLAQDVNATWGCIFGVDFLPGTRLSSLPVLGKDLVLADFLTFPKAAILLCTGNYNNFTLPALPNLPAPPAAPAAPPSQRAAQSAASGALLQLAPGVSLAAEVDFGKSEQPEVKSLASLLKQDQLVFQLALNTTGLQLMASLAGVLKIPTGKDPKNCLVMCDPRVAITLSTNPGFQFSGAMDIPIHGTTIRATATATLSVSGATVDVKLDSATPSAPGSPPPPPILPPPPGLPGISFTEICVLMGLSFEPPALELGFSGKFTIAGRDVASDDTFGIILEFIEEVPNPLYLAFSADTFSLGQIVAMVGIPDNPPSDPFTKFVNGFMATDVNFSWVDDPRGVALPDGSHVPAGLAFSGNVAIPLGDAGPALKVHADLKVGATGLSGSLQLAPLGTKETFLLTGDGKDITRTYEQINCVWSKVDNRQIVSRIPAPPTKTQVLVPGGGAAFTLSATIPPALSATVFVTIFEQTNAKAAAHIDASGFSFTLNFNIADAGRIDLNCTLKDMDALSAKADLDLKLAGDVGPVSINGTDCGRVHLETQIKGKLALDINPREFLLTAEGSFSFPGKTGLTMPPLKLDQKLSKLADLPGKLLESIGTEASTLFHDLFTDLSAWRNAVSKGLVKDYEDAAQVLKHAYKADVHEAAAVMRQIKEDASKVAKGLHAVYAQDSGMVATVMKNAGFPPRDVARGMKSAFSDITPETMGNELIAAGFAIQDVGVAVADVFGSAVDKASDWWKKTFGGG